MKLDSRIVEYLKIMNEASHSVENFFKEVAYEVERLDEKGYLMPPELDSIEWHMKWSLNKAVIDKLHRRDNSAFFQDDYLEDGAEWSLIDKAAIGIYFWSPKSNGAALSIYLAFDDEDEGIAYGKAKIAAKALKGTFYLFSDLWTEMEIELFRFDLKSLLKSEAAHKAVAKEIVHQTKRIIEVSYPE